MGSRKVVWVFDHQGSVYLDAQPLLATRNIDLLVLSRDNAGTISADSVSSLQKKFGAPDLLIINDEHSDCAADVVNTLTHNHAVWKNDASLPEGEAQEKNPVFRDATDLITRLMKFFSSSPVRQKIEIVLDQKNSMILLNGEKIRLTPREFDIFNYLYTAQDYTVPRKEFFRQIWNGLKVCNKVLDVHVSNLRKKIQGYGFKIQFTKPDSFALSLPEPAAEPEDPARAAKGSSPASDPILAATGV